MGQSPVRKYFDDTTENNNIYLKRNNLNKIGDEARNKKLKFIANIMSFNYSNYFRIKDTRLLLKDNKQRDPLLICKQDNIWNICVIL